MSTPRSREQLLALLGEQTDFLIASANRFDEGYEHEWKRLAITLRVLLYDHGSSSVSLLQQLQVKGTLDFLESDARSEPEPGTQVLYPVGWPLGLVGVHLGIGSGPSYFAMLDQDAGVPKAKVRFNEWWDKRLLDRPGSAHHWRRRDFVLGGANKEGAHIAQAPEPWWTDLRDGNWVGAATTAGPDSPVPVPVLANMTPPEVTGAAPKAAPVLERLSSQRPPKPGVAGSSPVSPAGLDRKSHDLRSLRVLGDPLWAAAAHVGRGHGLSATAAAKIGAEGAPRLRLGFVPPPGPALRPPLSGIRQPWAAA
jgi:hypothetical protein